MLWPIVMSSDTGFCSFYLFRVLLSVFWVFDIYPILVQLQKVKAELEEVSKNPERLILEAVHSAGYSGALANPLLVPESAIDRLNSGILEEFVTVRIFSILLVSLHIFLSFCQCLFCWIVVCFRGFQENYKGNRIVLAASGIEHKELLQIAEPLLSDLPAGPPLNEPKSVYVGGDFRRQADSPVRFYHNK